MRRGGNHARRVDGREDGPAVYLVQGARRGRWPAKSTQQDKQTGRHDPPCGPSRAHYVDEKAVPPIGGSHLHQIPSWSVAVVDPPRRENAWPLHRAVLPSGRIDARRPSVVVFTEKQFICRGELKISYKERKGSRNSVSTLYLR